jgi:hypothetical protein
MSGTAAMTDKRSGKYRTAIILAVLALGLFLFTLYAGLK